MKFLSLSCAVLSLTLLSTNLSFAKKLEIDPNHSTIGFEATHLKISKIPGRFTEFSGNIDLDEKDLTKTTVDFTADIASITTAVEKRDTHLKSPDFFDAAKFPKATFKNAKMTKAGKNYELTGDLTIRDVTKKITLAVKYLGKVEDPMMKTQKNVFSATGKINRKDFGVNYGPDAIVGDVVNLWVNLETAPAATP